MSLATDHELMPSRRYAPPAGSYRVQLQQILRKPGHQIVPERQLDLLRSDNQKDISVFLAGDRALLDRPSVAIVGARDASKEGLNRAYVLAKQLAAEGIVVVSGLAKGIDTAAHQGALDHRGRTIAVIGTPLTKAYPAENAALQEVIYSEHLLISPFAPGSTVFKGNFPKRNRVMALVSDATVIAEASDTSGSLHQAAECLRSDRWLFTMKSVADNSGLTWPAKFIGRPKVRVFSSTREVIDTISL